MNLWSAIKGLLVGAASLILLASDALGIQHSTVAKTIEAATKILNGTDGPPPR